MSNKKIVSPEDKGSSFSVEDSETVFDFRDYVSEYVKEVISKTRPTLNKSIVCIVNIPGEEIRNIKSYLTGVGFSRPTQKLSYTETLNIVTIDFDTKSYWINTMDPDFPNCSYSFEDFSDSFLSETGRTVGGKNVSSYDFLKNKTESTHYVEKCIFVYNLTPTNVSEICTFFEERRFVVKPSNKLRRDQSNYLYVDTLKKECSLNVEQPESDTTVFEYYEFEDIESLKKTYFRNDDSVLLEILLDDFYENKVPTKGSSEKSIFTVDEIEDRIEQLNNERSWYDQLESETSPDTPPPPPHTASEGHKESLDKLFYELDWTFVESMAERMATNKGKYKPYNWQKPIDVEGLTQALTRHFIEIQKGNYEDDGRPFGHLEAIACNMMMITYQLKNNKGNE